MSEVFDWSDYDFPVREKYIDERVPQFIRWMIFGERPDDTVDIADVNGEEIAIKVPREKAEAIIKARNEFVAAVLGAMNG